MIKNQALLFFICLKFFACSESTKSIENENLESTKQESVPCTDYLICDHENWIVCKRQHQGVEEFYFKNRFTKEKIALSDILKEHKIDLEGQKPDVSCGDGKNYDFKINAEYLVAMGKSYSDKGLKIVRK